jgi:acetoin utilization deacetylase AcuC-like enzyme
MARSVRILSGKDSLVVTAFFTDERFSAHTLPGHPEHAGRLEAVNALLREDGILNELHQIEAAPATEGQIRAVHTERYLNLLAETSSLKRTSMLNADTYITPQTYELARLASGGVCAVVDAVMRGEAQNGFAAVRPPGHHATPGIGMGFCLLNNIAIGARHALTAYNLERVAIVDYDVHHGNGTQDVFYDDPHVLFISSHQSPLYPGTGMLDEVGIGEGRGTTVNLPLPAGTGDSAFQTLYTEVVTPLLRHFQPDLILVSAGFDAHWVDPLANLALSMHGYNFLTQLLLELGKELCGGKVIFVMEGGYDLTALSHGWLNIARALLGKNELSDPLGVASQDKPLSQQLLEKFKETHTIP